MRKYALIAIGILVCSVWAEAQDLSGRQVVTVRPRRSPTLSAGLQLAVPTGEFAENYKGNPFGINAFLSIPFIDLPFEVGGGFAWNRMGGASQDVRITSNAGLPQPGTLRVNGNAYTYQAHGRLRPFNGKFRPYGELFVGVRNFSTNSTLKSDIGLQPSTERLNRSFTWLAGYGIGAKYEIRPGIFGEARFEKSAGTRAEYIDPESIQINNDGSFQFSKLSSRTDQWALSLGIAFSF